MGGYAELVMGSLESSDSRRQDLLEIRKAAERAATLTRQLLAFSRRQVLQPKVLDLNLLVGNVQKLLRRTVSEDIELVIDLNSDINPARPGSDRRDAERTPRREIGGQARVCARGSGRRQPPADSRSHAIAASYHLLAVAAGDCSQRFDIDLAVDLCGRGVTVSDIVRDRFQGQTGVDKALDARVP